MGQPVVHWELWSEDPARIGDFYQTVFGWNINTIPELDYRLVDTGGNGGINGGIMKPNVVDKVDVPGVGQLALFEDPEGRVLGMWQRVT